MIGAEKKGNIKVEDWKNQAQLLSTMLEEDVDFGVYLAEHGNVRHGGDKG